MADSPRFADEGVSAATAWIRRWQGAWAVAVLIAVALAGLEVSYWPAHDFPDAVWHFPDRGIDIEWAQAAAARAGWHELLGYWRGPMIPVGGAVYFRPLSSWLFVLEYHLFGREDRLWAYVSLALHLALVALLVLSAPWLVPGPRSRRRSVGLLAGVMFAAPGFADRDVQRWVLGWWPAQPEALSLLAGLALLMVTAHYVRAGTRRDLLLAPIILLAAVCFKETGYLAGAGACLLLARHRRRWNLLWTLVGCSAALLAYREWVLWPDGRGIGQFDPMRPIAWAWSWLPPLRSLAPVTAVHAALALLACGAGWVLRRQRPIVFAAVSLSLYFVPAAGIWGAPWEPAFRQGAAPILLLGAAGVLVWGLGSYRLRWPVPELCILAGLAAWVGACFPPVYGWYRYWGTFFGSLVAALALVGTAERAWRRWIADRGAETCTGFSSLVPAPTGAGSSPGSPAPTPAAPDSPGGSARC